MSASSSCHTCRHAVGWKRGRVEGWLCARGHAFAAIAGGTQLPSLRELRRVDLAGGETCPEWVKR
ncbi:MAG: hypothetical protein ABIH03_01060 [Pseudomonadota bacterium]